MLTITKLLLYYYSTYINEIYFLNPNEGALRTLLKGLINLGRAATPAGKDWLRPLTKANQNIFND